MNVDYSLGLLTGGILLSAVNFIPETINTNQIKATSLTALEMSIKWPIVVILIEQYETN